WQFPSPEGGGIVTVNYPFNLQAPEGGVAPSEPAVVAPTPAPATSTDPDAHVAIRCSDAASVSLPERVRLWRERLDGSSGTSGAIGVYRAARHACELPAWADCVALLNLMAAKFADVDGKINLYNSFGFDGSARSWFRSVILRQLARTGQLARAQE